MSWSEEKTLEKILSQGILDIKKSINDDILNEAQTMTETIFNFLQTMPEQIKNETLLSGSAISIPWAPPIYTGGIAGFINTYGNYRQVEYFGKGLLYYNMDDMQALITVDGAPINTYGAIEPSLNDTMNTYMGIGPIYFSKSIKLYGITDYSGGGYLTYIVLFT